MWFDTRLGCCFDVKLGTAEHRACDSRDTSTHIPCVCLVSGCGHENQKKAKWYDARWLGRCESSTEHLLLEVSTGEVVNARSVKKRPEISFLLRMTATPWSTKGNAVPTVPTSDDMVVPVSVPVVGR